jgi:hypothetical protein
MAAASVTAASTTRESTAQPVFTRGTFVEQCVGLLTRTRLREAMRTHVRSDDDRAAECQLGGKASEPGFELLK